MTDSLSASLAATLQAARVARDLTVTALADASGVSRAMIGKIERGEAQPTAVLLARLASALDLTLSELVARAEAGGGRLVRAADQPSWTDPDTGYTRRTVSPGTGGPVELVEIELPRGAVVDFARGTAGHQQIWLLAGRLRLREDDVEHVLAQGDCLELGPPAPRVFENAGDGVCRYLIAIGKRRM